MNTRGKNRRSPAPKSPQVGSGVKQEDMQIPLCDFETFIRAAMATGKPPKAKPTTKKAKAKRKAKKQRGKV